MTRGELRAAGFGTTSVMYKLESRFLNRLLFMSPRTCYRQRFKDRVEQIERKGKEWRRKNTFYFIKWGKRDSILTNRKKNNVSKRTR